MKELQEEENTARPFLGRAFLKRLPFVLPNLKSHLIFWPVFIGGLTLDLWSKKVVFDWLMQRQGESFSIVGGFLQLVMALNEGAAFGIAAGQRYLLAAISGIALILIFAVFVFGGAKQKLVHVVLGLLAAGVCGNLYDRIFNNGLVRDFIDVYWGRYHWPAFNIADSMLCIGVGLMIISTILTERSSQRRARRHK